jgi:hypothetical protein
MSRSVLIVVAAGAALLLMVAALRFSGSETEEERVRSRPPSAKPDRRLAPRGGSFRRDGGAAQTGRANKSTNADGERRERRGADRRDAGGRQRADGAAPAIGSRRGDAQRGVANAPRSGAGPALGTGTTANLPGHEINLREAVERLADAERTTPAPEESDDSADDLVHEPPATAVVDSSMTYTSGDYRFSIDSPFQIPSTGDAGTVALWLQPEWASGNQDDASLIELGDGQIHVYKNVNFLRFAVGSDAPEHSTGIPIDHWQPGEWHAVSATWANGEVSFYVDGQLVGQPIRGDLDLQGEAPVTIGSVYPPERPVAPATVSDISLRNRALSPREVAKFYNQSHLAPRPR